MTSPNYVLTLHKTYYDKGFFNLGVEVDRFVQKSGGPIKLRLGRAKRELTAKIDRNCNQNRTPRILGGPELRNWFQENFKLKDTVVVEIVSPSELWLRKQSE